MPRKVIRRRRVVRKRRAGPKRMRGGGKARVSSNANYAISTEGFEQPLTTDATGQFSFNFTTTLSSFNRSQEVAHAYKYYRCKKVELEFVPYANMSLTNGAASARLPQLYFQVDRICNHFIAPSEDEMIERGCTPKLFKQKLKYSWKPNLVQSVQMETNQPRDGTGALEGIQSLNSINSIPIYNKWLPTQQSWGYTIQPPNQQTNPSVVPAASNPYALRYYGAVAVISVEGGSQVEVIGDLITRVTWEFKGPRALRTDAPTEPTVVDQQTSTAVLGVIANTQPTVYP